MGRQVPISGDARATRPGNQARLLSRRRRWGDLGLAALAGLGMSATFPPLGWGWYAWLCLVPLLLLAMRPGARPLALGTCFGIAHCVTTYAWLRPVFILAPLLVTIGTFFYFALWMSLVMALYRNLASHEATDLRPRATTSEALPPLPVLSAGRQLLFVLAGAAAWCMLDWVRSWLFTGHPWNFLGASQWSTAWLLPLTSYTGVYGITYLLVAANLGIFLAIWSWHRRAELGERRPLPWGLATAVVLALLSLLAIGRYRLPAQPAQILRVAAVQGNIPQIRSYSDEELTNTIDVYTSLSREIVAAESPDLVVWPETAIPAPLLLDTEVVTALRELMVDIRTPLISGSVDYRRNPDNPEEIRSYNSAVYLNLREGRLRLLAYYDKMHIVPFGEYVPFGRYMPWLVDWIGMGRDLTRGTEHTVFRFGDHARIGPNICYEDVFPEISRGSVLNGANLLMTLTNDAWYEQTSGSRQHMRNSIFRATENFRPMMRSGNNADTLLIMPDGSIIDPLIDPATGSPFARRAGVYHIPIYEELPLTFYTRYGNLFAVLCTLASLLVMGWLGYRHFSRKQRLHDTISPADVPPTAG